MTWRAVCAACLLCVAVRAPAITAPTFFTGFNVGSLTGDDWTMVGTPTLAYDSTTAKWWVTLNPSASAAESIEHAVSGSPIDYTLGATMIVDAVPVPGASTGDAAEAIVGFMSGSTQKQVLMTLYSVRQADTSIVTKFRVRFNDLDTECSVNGLYPYTECTIAGQETECPEIVGGGEGESVCEDAIGGISTKITTGQQIRVAVTQDQGFTNSVIIGLIVDGYSVGNKARWQGVCDSGDNTGKACAIAGNCPNGDGDPCPITTIQAATTLAFGTTSTSGPAYTIRVSDIGFTPSVADIDSGYFRVAVLHPSTDVGTNQWTNIGCSTHADCADDSGDSPSTAPDDDTTRLSESANGDIEHWELTDPTIAGIETVVAARMEGILRNEGSNATVQFGLADSVTSLNVASHTVDGSSVWRVYDSPVATTMPAGGALNLNNLQGYVKNTNGVTVRITNAVAEAFVTLALPPVPSVFPDLNGDGDDTVCIVGDSTLNDQDIYDELVGNLPEIDNLIKEATGGTQTGQLRTAWSTLLDGASAGAFVAIPYKGSAAKCDVMIPMIGYNDLSAMDQQNAAGYCFQRGCRTSTCGGATTGVACKTTADCGGGQVCCDRSGPQHAGACGVPSGHTGDGGSFCTDGDSVQSTCNATSCGVGAGFASGCLGVGGSNIPCDAQGDCTTGTCQQWGLVGAADLTDTTYGWGPCVRGSITSPECPKGTCTKTSSNSYLTNLMASMFDTAAARTGSSTVTVATLGHYDGYTTERKRCVGGTRHGCNCEPDSGSGACAGSACTNGACKRVWSFNTATNALEGLRWWNQWLIGEATRRGWPYLNSGAYFRRLNRQAGSDPHRHIRDGVHLGSTTGQPEIAELITACLTRNTSIDENRCNDLSSATEPPLIYRLSSSATTVSLLDTFVCEEIGTPTATRTVDALCQHISTAAGNVKLSIYYSAPTFTKLATGCDTAGTAVAQAGWLCASTSGTCTLSAGTQYWLCSVTDSSALRYTVAQDRPSATVPLNKIGPVVSYASAMPATASPVVNGTYKYPWYAQVH